MILLLVVLLILAILAFQLIWRGWLWKLVLLIVGPLCIYYTLHHAYPTSNHTAFIIADYHISWAVLLPAALITLVLITSRKKQ